jgi:hypothetical protein
MHPQTLKEKYRKEREREKGSGANSMIHAKDYRVYPASHHDLSLNYIQYGFLRYGLHDKTNTTLIDFIIFLSFFHLNLRCPTMLMVHAYG